MVMTVKDAKTKRMGFCFASLAINRRLHGNQQDHLRVKRLPAVFVTELRCIGSDPMETAHHQERLQAVVAIFLGTARCIHQGVCTDYPHSNAAPHGAALL